MKRLPIALCIPLILLFHPVKALAQEEPTRIPSVPGWVSDKGYWEVESNIHSPWNSTIFFFNNDGIMVYKETLVNVPLDLQKRRTLRRLKKILDRSVTAWESGHPGPATELLVTRSLRRN
jgi:hypothetical protein